MKTRNKKYHLDRNKTYNNIYDVISKSQYFDAICTRRQRQQYLTCYIPLSIYLIPSIKNKIALLGPTIYFGMARTEECFSSLLRSSGSFSESSQNSDAVAPGT